MTRVVNTHHFGGVEKLPPNTVFIGRPSKYGNIYSSRTGKFTKEECVAFHRVDLYRDLIEDPLLFSQLQKELKDKDLACFCKHLKYLKACHGDNFVHIFNDRNINRDYSRSVVFYLMDDLRYCLNYLKRWVIETKDIDFVKLYIGVVEAKLEIDFLLTVIGNKKPNREVVCEYLARVVIELELAIAETDPDLKVYWLTHVGWIIGKMIMPPDVVGDEPIKPSAIIKRNKK